ncbi:MAG: D-TA family PLP-dependent enzyme [Flavisolibacter sp.]
MALANQWYEVESINDLDSPALLIYKERVIENIQKAIGMVSSIENLRPHIKTHKTKQISLLMKQAGILKFKCATIAEADILGMIQAPDVLLAYQPVAPKIKRFLSLIKDYAHTRFSCLVDNMDSALAIAQEAEKNYLEVCVFIDINSGMNRSGCPALKARAFFEDCAKLKGIVPVGFHFYDGHLHHFPLEEMKRQAEEGILIVIDAKKELERKGFTEVSIIAGGTPTFPIHAVNKTLECSPGTFVLWDNGYSNRYKELPFQQAALVLTRVISLPAKNLICVDLGYKSIASEDVLSKRVHFLNAPELVAVSHSEEHMVLQAPSDHNYKIGDTLYGVPQHICPTCALFERATLIDNREIREEWMIFARDRRIEH